MDEANTCFAKRSDLDNLQKTDQMSKKKEIPTLIKIGNA